jgi:septum formation protein
LNHELKITAIKDTMPIFILASSSPRRRELLGSLSIPFTIIKPDIDETQHPGEPPLEYVARLSREKAQAVASQLPHPLTPSPSNGEGESVILAADTVVILGADTLGVDEHGEILGKPVDADDARDMLRRLRGRVHQVCTAMTLLVASVSETTSITRITSTNVTMRDYSDAEIEAYIATGDPFDKAGSYAIQHPEFKPVAKIDGCYTNVVGLPGCTLKNMLAQIGWPGIQPVQACDCASATDQPGH